jgi:hypothetical protein
MIGGWCTGQKRTSTIKTCAFKTQLKTPTKSFVGEKIITEKGKVWAWLARRQSFCITFVDSQRGRKEDGGSILDTLYI